MVGRDVLQYMCTVTEATVGREHRREGVTANLGLLVKAAASKGPRTHMHVHTDDLA